MRKLFYPKSWLDATGYWDNKPNTGPGVILFNPNSYNGNNEYKVSINTVIILLLISIILSVLLSIFLTRKYYLNPNHRKYQYVTIEV